MTISISPEIQSFLESKSVAHLATADASGVPHVVPICYTVENSTLHFLLDSKPKTVSPYQLKRVKNISQNPNVSVVVDQYSDNWNELAYVLLRGKAFIMPDFDKSSEVIKSIRSRYPQYNEITIEQAILVKVEIENAYTWGTIFNETNKSLETSPLEDIVDTDLNFDPLNN